MATLVALLSDSHLNEDSKELVKAFRNFPDLVVVLSISAAARTQWPPRSSTPLTCYSLHPVATSAAFGALNTIYGSNTAKSSALKRYFLLLYNIMKQADLSKIINSSEIQKVLRPK